MICDTDPKKVDLANRLNFKTFKIDEIFKKADVITVHIPLNKKNENLINSRLFDITENNPILINIARGGIVDEDCLVRAIKEGKISAAHLDVFDSEPKAPDRYQNFPNVVTTPHIGGSSYEAISSMSLAALENLIGMAQMFTGK